MGETPGSPETIDAQLHTWSPDSRDHPWDRGWIADTDERVKRLFDSPVEPEARLGGWTTRPSIEQCA